MEDVVEVKATLSLDDLDCMKPKLKEKLVEAGYDTVVKIARAKITELTDIDGVGEKTAIDCIAESQELTGIGGTVNANDLFIKHEKQRRHISLCHGDNKNIDELLGGKGAETTQSILIFGADGASKTQVVCQGVANCILPTELGGAGQNALFIDVENISRQFLPRLMEMVRHSGGDPEECLQRLDVAVCNSTEMQVSALRRAINSPKEYGLLAIDGIMTKFRSEYIGRGTLAERQGILGEHVHDIESFGILKDAVVLITTQVHAKPDQYGDPLNLVGGYVLSHNVKHILKVRKGAKGKRVARLVKSGSLPEAECLYEITNAGVVDA